MSSALPNFAENPYASPQTNCPPPPNIPAAAAKPGSVGMVLGGLVLMLVGYLASNLFLISDLYHLGFGPNGEAIPSPLGMAVQSPAQLWMIYAGFAAAFVAGAVMMGSQGFNPVTIVCYVMCPLAAFVYFAGLPLRSARKYAEAVATIYLVIGSCLVCTGATRLFLLYGQPADDFAPVTASMMTEVGLALVVGSLLKFWRIAPARHDSSEGVIAAELVAAPTNSQ